MDVMTIGEAACTVGVSPKAIRLWEAKGLIPVAERTTGGYRSFTDTDLGRLRFIRQAKNLGLTLDEIRSIIDMQYVGASPCGRVRQAIDNHLDAIDRQIADLVQLRNVLTVTKNAADTACHGDSEGAVCHIIERVIRPECDREREYIGRG